MCCAPRGGVDRRWLRTGVWSCECSNRPYNAKSDVWALGVVLYELCQLRVPFDAANFPQLRVKIVHNQPAPLNGPYSKELQQLVTDMLVRPLPPSLL